MPLFLQTAALVGMYGLVFLILVVNTGLTEALVALKERRPLPKLPLGLAVGIVGFMALYGALRLGNEPTPERTLKIALLQGNIEQGIKNEERLYGPLILERYWELQARAVEEGAELVVWPEAALPVGLKADAKSLANTKVVPHDGPYAGIVPPSGIIGATAAEHVVDPVTGKRKLARYNTAFATEKDLVVKGRFDKVHLVPFGEYVPWPFSPVVRHLVPGLSTPGDGFHAATVETPKGPVRVGATICYEGAFPEITRAYVDDGAELMFNVTNDAWYGISSMTWQHTLLYAARAVESGRAVARAANTGVSAWVDTRGRVHDTSAMYETTYVLADVPLHTEDTLYQRTGDVVALACVVGALALWFYCLAGFGFWRRERHPIEWIVGVLGVAVGAYTLLDHHLLRPPTLESESTWNQLQFIFAMLIGLGALSGRPWGRKAQVWVAAATLLLAVAGLFFSSTAGILPAAVTLVVAVLAFRRREAYQRPPDVPVAGPYAVAAYAVAPDRGP